MRRLNQLAGVFLVFVMLGVAPLSAQESVMVSPSQLVIKAVQGERLTRTLLIRSTEQLRSVQVMALDLVDAAGDTQFPAGAVTIDAVPGALAPDEPVTLLLTFDLATAQPGSYSGELLISYQGGSRSVPVQLHVKSQPWLPLLSLIAGIALGVGVSSYRVRGRPRDEVMVRLGQLRTQLKVDEELHTLGLPFLQRIDAALADVEVALEGQQWSEAESAADEAYAVWKRWRRGRPDWIVQFTAYRELMERLSALSEHSALARQLLQSARDTYRNAPDQAEPGAFREQIALLIQKTNQVLSLQVRLSALSSVEPKGSIHAAILRQRLDELSPLGDAGDQQLKALDEELEGTLSRLRKETLAELLGFLKARSDEESGALVTAFEARVEALPPRADSAYAELLNELMDASDTWEPGEAPPAGQEVSPSLPYALRGTGVGDTGEDTRAQLLASLPTVRVQSLGEDVQRASQRLRWFRWLTYAVTVALLALAGFAELYGMRADFGANGTGDYFALLAWGFGAEATRSAISDMIQSWGLIRQ
jgi:hypothetical protein